MPLYIFVFNLPAGQKKSKGLWIYNPAFFVVLFYHGSFFYSKPSCEKTGEPIKVCYENHQMSVALSITWGCCKTLRDPLLPFYLKGFLER